VITYLTLTFSSEGAKPSEVISALEVLGFRPATGFYDFQYEWEDNASLEDVVVLADKVSSTLKGMNALFKMETTKG
jgi:hypothetical protein